MISMISRRSSRESRAQAAGDLAIRVNRAFALMERCSAKAERLRVCNRINRRLKNAMVSITIAVVLPTKGTFVNRAKSVTKEHAFRNVMVANSFADQVTYARQMVYALISRASL